MGVAADAAGELQLKPLARCLPLPPLAVPPGRAEGREPANDGIRGHNAARPAGPIAGNFVC